MSKGKGKIVSVLHEGRAWQAVLLLPTEELLAAPRGMTRGLQLMNAVDSKVIAGVAEEAMDHALADETLDWSKPELQALWKNLLVIAQGNGENA